MYDIDKAYIMGQEFGEDGRLIKYSNLFNFSSLEAIQASSWLPTPKNIRVFENISDIWEEAKTADTTNNNNKQRNKFKLDNRLFTYEDNKKVLFDDAQVDQIMSESFNVDSYLEELQQYYNNEDTPKYIRAIANVIIDIYDEMDRRGSSDFINISYSQKYKVIASKVVDDIITHERTVISANLEEAAYKNSISANIRNIVQDLKNMDLAYQPITMEDLRKLAEKSEKGALVANMSLMNPATKYLMQVQNMVGKKVIGIAAVGEKVFFNLSYYYNEGVRSGDEKWIKNMQFSHTFDRIQGRYQYSQGLLGNLKSATKTSLANVNFDGVEDIRERFMSLALKEEQLRKKHKLTDADFASIDSENGPTAKYQLYKAELDKMSLEQAKQLHREATDCPPVDLLISQLLSAATDNAKELILKKINCDDNLAKFHLYLIMLGFDIKDVVSFMTSPAINLVSDLLETNMMDSYITKLKIDQAIDIAQGLIDPRLFLFGTEDNIDPETKQIKYLSRADIAYNNLSSLKKVLLPRYKEKHPNATKFSSFNALISEYIQARIDNFEVNGKPLESLDFYLGIHKKNKKRYEVRKGMERLSDYVEKVINDVGNTRAKYAQKYRKFRDEDLNYLAVVEEGSLEEATFMAEYDEDYRQAMQKGWDEFKADLDEFKRILKLANETTELGGVMLGMNQGLPSDKVALQEKLRKIESIMTTREDEFDIKHGSFIFRTSSQTQNPEKALKDARKVMSSKFLKMIKHNSFLDGIADEEGFLDPDSYLYQVLEQATAFDIVGNFDVEKWLNNVLLTKEDINTETNFYGSKINTNRVLEGKESITYREVVANYYNVIKGTWNIFDIMNRVPQYNAILDLLKTVYNIDKYSSLKSSLTNRIYKDVYKVTNFIDEKQNKVIITFVNDLITTAFFRQSNLQFPIYTGTKYLNNVYKTKYSESDREVADLNNAPGRASFKVAFEQAIASIQASNEYGPVKFEETDGNALIEDLQSNYDKNEVPRLALDMDMMRINGSPVTQKRFQEYLDGLYKLKGDKKIGKLPLSDWIIAYNLFVNQNQYGSDRLTTIFKNSIAGQNSLLERYFKFIGNLDYNKPTDELLEDLEYNIEDLLVRLAPVVSRSEKARSFLPYIKSKNDKGELVVWKKIGKTAGNYRELSLFPTENLGDVEALEVSEEQKSNYDQNQMIRMKNQDFVVSLRQGLMSGKEDTVLDTLITYARGNLITIFKDC